MLSPADINDKQFSTTRLKEGYDQNEVDDFLDDVAASWQVQAAALARLEEENRTLRRKLDAASNAPTERLDPVVTAPSAVAEKLLAAAQKAHDEHVADGKAEADALVRAAGAKGAQIVEEATEAAEKIKSEGLAEKYRRVDELQKKIESGERAYADLRSRADQVRRVASEALDAYNQEFGS